MTDDDPPPPPLEDEEAWLTMMLNRELEDAAHDNAE